MKTEIELLQNVSTNISKLRKSNNYTQLELAEKLGYSDKSISKWERGEALPDLVILIKIAELFDVSLNDLILEDGIEIKKENYKKKRKLITLLSFGLPWLVATLVYVLLELIYPNDYSWLSFIYAIPVSMIVLIVFTKLWGSRMSLFLSITGLYWTLALSLYLSFNHSNIWLLFILVIPLQLLTIIWFIYVRKKNSR